MAEILLKKLKRQGYFLHAPNDAILVKSFLKEIEDSESCLLPTKIRWESNEELYLIDWDRISMVLLDNECGEITHYKTSDEIEYFSFNTISEALLILQCIFDGPTSSS